MRHKANTSLANTSTLEEVWFVDSGASNHMTSHEEWFSDLRTPDRPGYMETGDDTTHTIRHICNVPLGKGNNNEIKNVLHIPIITNNLVSVSPIMEQGMQVRFNNGDCFIERNGRLIARGQREGQIFILDSEEVKLAMFAKVLKVESISSCGTRESATSTFNGSELCSRRE